MRMAKFLDRAIDVTHIASILVLPVIVLLFERRLPITAAAPSVGRGRWC
jgi:hypothetical protein